MSAATDLRLIIRPGRPSDASRLADIDAAVSLNPLSRTQLEGLCGSSESVLWVASGMEGLLGFIALTPGIDESSVLALSVSTAVQRQGIGRHLLRFALDVCRDRGDMRCLLEVRASNAAALQLYVSMGFERDGLRPNYYRSETGREDAILMSCLLSRPDRSASKVEERLL